MALLSMPNPDKNCIIITIIQSLFTSYINPSWMYSSKQKMVYKFRCDKE